MQGDFKDGKEETLITPDSHSCVSLNQAGLFFSWLARRKQWEDWNGL